MNKLFRVGVRIWLLGAGCVLSWGQAPNRDVAQSEAAPPPVNQPLVALENSMLPWYEIGRVDVPGLDGIANAGDIFGEYPHEPFRDGTDVYLPLGTYGNGFIIFDFQDPEFPAVVSSVGEIASRDIVVANGLAYSVDGNRLHIVDVAQTRSPSIVGSLDLSGEYGAAAASVTVSGSVAYVTGGGYFWLGEYPALLAIDVSNPSSPQPLGASAQSGGADVVTDGSIAYVASYGRGLRVYDIANPSNITLLRSLDTGGDAVKVQVVGDYAYVYNVAGSFSLAVVDISVPAASIVRGVATIPLDWVAGDGFYPGQFLGLRVDDCMVYVTGSHGVVLVDATNPDLPEPVGRLAADEFTGGVELMDDLIIAAGSTALVAVRLGSAPVAIAGPALDAGGRLIVDASGSFDPDGAIVSYLWSLQNRDELGTSFEFNQPTIDASSLEEGVYDVRLVLEDDTGLLSDPVAFPLAVPGCSVGDSGGGTDQVMAVIDIEPGDYPNSINPDSYGVIPVAVLGADTFDVSHIDMGTLAFGPGAAPMTHPSGHPQDVNLDGFTDLVVHFRTQDTGIECEDESVTLSGGTVDGQRFEGTDSIQTMGCRVTGMPAIRMMDQDARDASREGGLDNLERK